MRKIWDFLISVFSLFLLSDLKKSQICPIWDQSDPILLPNLTSLLHTSHLYSRDVRVVPRLCQYRPKFDKSGTFKTSFSTFWLISDSPVVLCASLLLGSSLLYKYSIIINSPVALKNRLLDIQIRFSIDIKLFTRRYKMYHELYINHQNMWDRELKPRLERQQVIMK